MRCEACANFKMDIENAKTTEAEDEARKLFKEHLEKQEAYRDLYTYVI